MSNEDRLSASEALFGFCAWLSAEPESMSIGANEDCAQWAEAVDAFCKRNWLEEPKDGWEKRLAFPEGKSHEAAFRWVSSRRPFSGAAPDPPEDPE